MTQLPGRIRPHLQGFKTYDYRNLSEIDFLISTCAFLSIRICLGHRLFTTRQRILIVASSFTPHALRSFCLGHSGHSGGSGIIQVLENKNAPNPEKSDFLFVVRERNAILRQPIGGHLARWHIA